MSEHVLEDVWRSDDEDDVLDQLDDAAAELGEIFALLQNALSVGLDLQQQITKFGDVFLLAEREHIRTMKIGNGTKIKVSIWNAGVGDPGLRPFSSFGLIVSDA